jgi:hypothetical protein
MPRVGSSRISTFGSMASHLPRTTFCWFPPLRFSTGVSIGRFHASFDDGADAVASFVTDTSLAVA